MRLDQARALKIYESHQTCNPKWKYFKNEFNCKSSKISISHINIISCAVVHIPQWNETNLIIKEILENREGGWEKTKLSFNQQELPVHSIDKLCGCLLIKSIIFCALFRNSCALHYFFCPSPTPSPYAYPFPPMNVSVQLGCMNLVAWT